MHSELIPLAGGVNAVKCTSPEYTAVEKLSMEQVMIINPDAIVTLNTSFAANVYHDKIWQDIKAVKTKRVYLPPREPINWFDMPPSFMGMLGLQWLTNRLYPDLYPKDIEKKHSIFSSYSL